MSKATYICMNDVQEESIDWLWYPYIAFGKLTIIQGDPGEGKTTLILNIAAKLSKGEFLEENENINEPINVIYQTAEDGLADTIKPRLVKAGADCKRIFVIDESEKLLSMDDERLEEAINTHRARLLVLDPLQAYLGGSVDMHRANEVREMTRKIKAVAERTRCAVVLIGHMNKALTAKATYRGLGSIDLFAAVRSVLLVGKIHDEENLKGMVQIKSNNGPVSKAKAFKITDNGFEWKGDYNITAEEIALGFRNENKVERAKQLLRDLAKNNSSIKSDDAVLLAKSHGISKRTLQEAQKEIGVKAKRKGNAWYLDFANIAVD